MAHTPSIPQLKPKYIELAPLQRYTQPMRIQAKNLLILLPGTVWGVSFILIELILPYIEPITMTLLRALISLVALYPVMRITGSYFPRTWRAWLPYFILAAMNQATPFALTAWGQKFIDGGLASILLSIMPLFTVLLAFFLTDDEGLSFSKIAGIFLGLVGIVILIGPTALEGLGINLWAQLAVVVSALLYALGAIYIRYLYRIEPKDMSTWALRLRIANAQFVTSVVMLTPFSLWLETPFNFNVIPPEVWGYLFLLGTAVTMLATIVYYYLIEEFGAGRASMTVYLIPVAGVISGVIILDEELTGAMIVALVLIALGVYVVDRGEQVQS